MYIAKLYNKDVTVHDYKSIRNPLRELLKKSYPMRVSPKKDFYESMFMTFDIETTTTKNIAENSRKKGKFSHFNYTYHWQACIGGLLVTGRYIDEFFELCRWLSETAENKIICFVQNLAYEYNNLAEWFIENAEDPENDFFFKDTIHPLKILNRKIEFRCSFQLTHKSLSTLSDEIGLEKPKEFEYDTPRHSETSLDQEEIEYCLRDVYNLYIWVKKEIFRYCESINHSAHVCYLPLTQTGYVRYDIRHNWSNTNAGRYILKSMEMDADEYYLCRQAFRGGDTHANFRYIANRLDKIFHRDFTSAYPAKMCLEKFPMGGWVKEGNSNISSVLKLIRRGRGVIATYHLKNVCLKKGKVGYIAKSKCDYLSDDCLCENGRVMQCSDVYLTICDIDVIIIAETYNFTVEHVINCMHVRKRYLPDGVITTILKYFHEKTTYKGVVGKEEDYSLSKQKINGIYGCCASRLDHEVINIDPITLESYKNGGSFENSRVVPYQWAVYITAYVRRDLHIMRQHTKAPIYWDTDSVFYEEDIEFEKFVEDYNTNNINRLKKLSKRLAIDWNIVAPFNKKGERQYLGNFTADDDYRIEKFITVGAKRYVYRLNGVDTMVFSGVRSGKPVYNKQTGVSKEGYSVTYIAKKYGDGDIYKAFEKFPKTEILIPYKEKYGKLSNYVERGDFFGYIDDGETVQSVSAKASMVLVPVDITLSLEPSLFNLLYANSYVLETF